MSCTQSRKHQIYTSIVNLCAVKLEELYKREGVENAMDHSKKVLEHMIKAFDFSYIDISEERKLSLLLGALLHQADDKRYFGKNS